MKKRICPVCDQEMHSPHYCRICKSWVKEPYIREVNYYLNAAHPKGETGCTYHNDEKPVPAIPPLIRAGEREQTDRERERRKPGSKFRWVLWLFLFIYVIMPLFGSLMGTVVYFFRHLFR